MDGRRIGGRGSAILVAVDLVSGRGFPGRSRICLAELGAAGPVQFRSLDREGTPDPAPEGDCGASAPAVVSRFRYSDRSGSFAVQSPGGVVAGPGSVYGDGPVSYRVRHPRSHVTSRVRLDAFGCALCGGRDRNLRGVERSAAGSCCGAGMGAKWLSYSWGGVAGPRSFCDTASVQSSVRPSGTGITGGDCACRTE